MLVVVSFRRDMSDIDGDMAVVEANGGRNIAM
jgi:hypothetical protein